MACDVKSMFLCPVWIKLISVCVNSVLFLQTRFPWKLAKRGTIQASWEACIVNIFPRCFICTFSGWKLFLFGPSTWFSFGWLWFLYYPEHLGPRLLFIAVWKQPILFLFTQFGPSLNLWTASNIHCHLTKLGLEYPEFWKAGLALPLVTQRAFQQDWL